MENYTNEEIFALCANKSLDYIKNMTDEDLKSQALRYYFSRLLMDYPEENPLKCDIILDTKEDNGLSDLEKLHIIAMSQTPCEGYINIMFEGSTEWNDIDLLDCEEQVNLLEQIEKELN